MKIFLVCNSLGGGGAERVGVNLANGFADAGHTVFMLTDLLQKATYPIDKRVKLIAFCEKKVGKLKKWSSAVRCIRRQAKEHRPDAIIGIMHLCSFAAKVAVTGLGIPVVLTIHHALERIESLQTSRLNIFCDRQLSRIYDRVTVLTQADALALGKRKKVSVMPNPSTFSPCEGFIKKENIILSAGRLDDWKFKGFDLLIEAWGRIAANFPSWNLQIAGAGNNDTIRFFEKLAKDHNVFNRVVFLGYRTDMESLYQRSAIYCLSSRSEGLPMVLIEAMSQGCAPVACENLGRTKEIITNESEGLLFKTADAEDLADKLSRMIVDNDYRQSVQRNAVERSKYYSLDHIIGMWEEMLENIKKTKE